MSEIFKTRVVESPQEPEMAPQGPKPIPSDAIPPGAEKASDPSTPEEKKLDIWEGLNRTKYVNEFFNIKEYAEEFGLKMQTAAIDKYVRSELEKRSWEKNTDNWEKVLGEIEEEIGSGRMELFSRISKITGYVRAINRLYKAKELKEKYLNSTIE